MKFIVDAMLGKLAKWLRILGFDALYFRDTSSMDLVWIARKEDRILLTRNGRLARARDVKLIFIRNDHLSEQLRQVVDELKLNIKSDKLFSRCLNCNELLIEISKEDVADLVPQYVYDTQHFFSKCPSCMKIYWAATHMDKMRKRLDDLLS